MFPFSLSGPIHLHCWVQILGVTFEAEIIDADGSTRTAQVIRLGTLVVHAVPFSALASVSLREGNYVLAAFGRPSSAQIPAWVHYAEVVS
jgi:hypothetical protein